MEKEDTPPIKRYDKAYVAMLDILGFKEFVTHANPETVISTFDKLTTIVANQLSHTMKFDDKGNMTLVQNEHQDFNYVIISDTILIWTENTDYNTFYTILYVVKNIMYHAFKLYIPLRGAIVVGSMALFDRREQTNKINVQASFVGKAIVEAYELSNSQDWSGCYVTDDCLKIGVEEYEKFKLENSSDIHFRDALQGVHESNMELLVKYPIPFKKGKVDGFALKWVEVGEAHPVYPDQVEETFAKDKNYQGETAVKLKITNTIDFVSTVIGKHAGI